MPTPPTVTPKTKSSVKKTVIDETTGTRDNQGSQNSSATMLHPLHLADQPGKTAPDTTAMPKKAKPALFVITLLVAIAAGIGTGYGSYQLYAQSPSGKLSDIQTLPTEGSISPGAIFGSSDTDTFKDSAEGYLEKGTAGEEGTHQLLREGGETQTVTLTSSVTDLDALVGMDVKVWGETFRSQSSGWLMDVGRVEVVAVSGTKPQME